MDVSPIILGTQTFVPIATKVDRHGKEAQKYINTDQIADLVVNEQGTVECTKKGGSSMGGNIPEKLAMNVDELKKLDTRA